MPFLEGSLFKYLSSKTISSTGGLLSSDEIPQEAIQLREKWYELRRSGKRKEADDLLSNELYAVIEKRFVQNVQEQIKTGEIPQYDLLLLPYGLEWLHAVLLINALKPKHVYFMGTREAEGVFLDEIIARTQLKPSQYTREVIEYQAMDTDVVYEKIKRHLQLFGTNKKVAVDLTRGKRVMNAAAAMVGAFFGCDLIYVDADWFEEIRHEVPLTEKFVRVHNPFLIFGDLESRYAVELFNHHDYMSAKNLFRELCGKSRDPREFEIKAMLADAYNAWDGYDYAAAHAFFTKLMAKIQQYSFVSDYLMQIRNNLEAVKALSGINQEKANFLSALRNDDVISHLFADFFCGSLRRAEQGRLSGAVLRFYRTVEFISQHRLAKYGIETETPDYTKLPGIEEKYADLTEKVFKQRKKLPEHIALMDGHTILYAIQDDLWKGKTLKDLDDFLQLSKVRDHSILIHGIGLTTMHNYKNVEAMAKQMVSLACKLNSKNADELIRNHTFIKL